MSVNGVAINVGQRWRTKDGQELQVMTRTSWPPDYPWTLSPPDRRHRYCFSDYGVSQVDINFQLEYLLSTTDAMKFPEIKVGQRWRTRGGGSVIVTEFLPDRGPLTRHVWMVISQENPKRTWGVFADGSNDTHPSDADILWEIPNTAAAPTDSNTKATNPKEAIGDKKTPLWLCSAIAMAHWSAAQFAGLIKYGAWNWRAAGVRSSTYVSAIKRHIARWENGERCDPVDGTHHLGNIMACCAILLEAEAIGKLNDDRSPRADLQATFDEVEAVVARLKEVYADKAPKHWTINDELPS